MIASQWATIGIALGVAAVILYLVRRSHLHGLYSLWWITVAAVIVLLAVAPGLIDQVAGWLGVGYPPILIVILGFAALLIKLLTMDLERSRQALMIRRLTQRLAMLEKDKDNS